MDTTRALKAIEELRATTGVQTKDLDPVALTKADGESGVVAGYGSKWWVVDSTADVTAPGAFLKTIEERGPKSATPRIVMRYEHEVTVGAYREMSEDEHGLKVEGFITDDGMYGTALRRQLKDGVPYGMSIGYKVIGSRPATEADPLILDHAPSYVKDFIMSQGPSAVRVLTELKMPELSIVTFPSVDNALVDSYKSALDLTAKAIDRLAADIKAGRLTDDHLTHIRRLVADLPAAIDPKSGETPPSVENQTAVVAKRNYLAELDLVLSGAGLHLEGLSL